MTSTENRTEQATRAPGTGCRASLGAIRTRRPYRPPMNAEPPAEPPDRRPHSDHASENRRPHTAPSRSHRDGAVVSRASGEAAFPRRGRIMNTIARKGGLWIAAGTVVGVAAGVALGAASVGLALGLAAGIVAGLLAKR